MRLATESARTSRSGQLLAGLIATIALVAPAHASAALEIEVSPSSIDLGSQQVFTTSEPSAVQVTNTGSDQVDITEFAITGTNPGDFQVGVGTCSAPPFIFSADRSCTLSVNFTPSELGERVATLRIVSNAAGSPHYVALEGDGTPAPVPAKADATIRRSKDTAFIGNDIYEVPAITQVASWSARKGQTRTFVIGLENDGPNLGAIQVDGCSSTAKFAVHYYAGDNDITYDVTRLGYGTGELAPGAQATPIQLRIKPKRSSGQLACRVATAATNDGPDWVQANLRATD